MRYNPTDRIGVNETERIFLTEFNWIFREQPIVDVGIDALIEQSENGNPTGKFIALQIKSGKGNFHISNNKITYYLSNIHYSYWLNFDIPVILIAHLPDSNETYWEEISERKIKRAKKRWKLEIPKSNKLNLKAKPKLTKLLTDKKYEFSSLNIFRGENIDEDTIFDLAEKSNCISDANESTAKTVELLEELAHKTTESNKKFEYYNKQDKSFKSPEVRASVKGYAKNLNIYARRLESESQIFSEMFGEGVFAFEQAILIHFLLTKDIINLKSSLKSIKGLPNALDNTIESINFMREKIDSLPNKFTPLKEGKKNLLLVVDLMIDEYLIAKKMTSDLTKSLEMEINNNC